ncbi:DUF2474 family protein [Falsiroseomonas selenitidurans]|uniref:DUF2474 family protein n=1 Tax=Falsiroseomonas selenitidurans TaxID=2716335 RepID=A0ABX1DWT6_9PROT|nr:DUF2474 family protein [Falsiroseomonas selenitidurans]NKC29389.1 DUF2474 family protein [Falsiroseomonas selenitidurans]
MAHTRSLPRRLLWFALIWAASVAGLGVVGLAIKAMLR